MARRNASPSSGVRILPKADTRTSFPSFPQVPAPFAVQSSSPPQHRSLLRLVVFCRKIAPVSAFLTPPVVEWSEKRRCLRETVARHPSEFLPRRRYRTHSQNPFLRRPPPNCKKLSKITKFCAISLAHPHSISYPRISSRTTWVKAPKTAHQEPEITEDPRVNVTQFDEKIDKLLDHVYILKSAHNKLDCTARNITTIGSGVWAKTEPLAGTNTDLFTKTPSWFSE